MIKGKFYAGLPSEMMSRARTVNRQQTNFFWPDEADAESAAPRATNKHITSKTSTSFTTTNNNSDAIQSDIKPKELVRKQLSSGIEFYDNVNAKTPEMRRRRFKKIDNINLNNNNDFDFQPEKKKLETFSSKIEFYDFEPEHNKNVIEKNERPIKTFNRIETKNEEIKLKNDSPEVSKKRISFQAEEKSVEKTKSILKNSDEKPLVEKVVVKPLPKRGLLPKNLSKSVENISKMAKNFADDEVTEKKPETLSTIIKEVKNLHLSKDGNRQNTNDYGRNDYGREPRRGRTDRDLDRGYDDYPTDRYDRRGYRESEYRYRNEERSRNDPYRYNNRYDDYDDYDGGEREYSNRRNERSQRVAYSQPRDPYRNRSGRYDETPIRDRRAPQYDHYDYDRDYEIESKPSRSMPVRDLKPSVREPSPRKTIDRHYDEPPSRSVRYEEEDEYSTCISRKPKHIPQHLRTNILTNGKVAPQAQRPSSVRSSAVTRVGVGLPDYE